MCLKRALISLGEHHRRVAPVLEPTPNEKWDRWDRRDQWECVISSRATGPGECRGGVFTDPVCCTESVHASGVCV